MKLEHLTDEERAVVEWQYRMCGGFMAALWEAICRADAGNLAKLERAFPLEVNAFRKFAYLPEWYPALERKLFKEQ